MYNGKRIKRHCYRCEETKVIDVSIGYKLEGTTYYINCRCPKCNADLSGRDMEIVTRANEKNKNISVIMY